MKERPILFSASMVRAILEGRKTQTRRIVTYLRGFGRVTEFGTSDAAGYDWHFRDRDMRWNDLRNDRLLQTCPYGQTGDRLWVRETVWIPRPRTQHDMRDGADTWPKCIYSADTDAIEIEWMQAHRWKQRPSIHMPRWAARITLEVTGVRVERLQDISEEQALAEGVATCEGGGWDYAANDWAQGFSAVSSFRTLWESINGPGSWNANPWVWVIEFRRMESAP